MEYPCGCYVGAWMGITPPPQCDGTNCSLRRNVVAGGWGSYDNTWVSTTITTTTPPSTPDELIAKLVETIHAEAGKADAAGDEGAHDAWQHALNGARNLRKLIEYARESKS